MPVPTDPVWRTESLPILDLDNPKRARRCQACGYDLRGLPQPRCPECGLIFDLTEWRRPPRRWLGRLGVVISVVSATCVVRFTIAASTLWIKAETLLVSWCGTPAAAARTRADEAFLMALLFALPTSIGTGLTVVARSGSKAARLALVIALVTWLTCFLVLKFA